MEQEQIMDSKVSRWEACLLCGHTGPKVRLLMDLRYAELQKATDNFRSANFLWDDGYGKFIKGVLENGLWIMVKQKCSAASRLTEEEFRSGIDALRKIEHGNVVRLLGSCAEGNHRLLVYEYVSDSSLEDALLRRSEKPLRWESRMKLSVDIARALQYLHKNKIVYGNIRPNQILLTHESKPMLLLGTFGLCKPEPREFDYSSDNVSYLAPEYAKTGRASTKADVYSFGVVLLRLISGQNSTFMSVEGESVLAWAKPLLKDMKYPDLIDHSIYNFVNIHQLFWMVRIAHRCISTDPRKRLIARCITSITRECSMDGNITFEVSPTHADQCLVSFKILQLPVPLCKSVFSASSFTSNNTMSSESDFNISNQECLC